MNGSVEIRRNTVSQCRSIFYILYNYFNNYFNFLNKFDKLFLYLHPIIVSRFNQISLMDRVRL